MVPAETSIKLTGEELKLDAKGDAIRATLPDEQVHLDVQIKRAFPFSHPDSFFAILDSEGKEIAMLEDPAGLDADSVKILNNALDRRYYTPRISEILFIKADAGMWKFGAISNRGPTEFYVKNWRDSAFEVSANRWHIMAVDGKRFVIPDLEALDHASRKQLDQLL